jgi:type VI secretion system secreted protein VgrG
LTLDDLVVREKRPLRRQNFEAKTTPAAASADTQVTSSNAATKAADTSKNGSLPKASKQPGYLTADGKPIHLPVRASQYAEENAATNKLPREMKPSQELIDALKRNEGKRVDENTGRHTEYTDSAGYRTIGYGHRLADNETYPDGITEEQARELFVKDLQIAADRVNRAVKVLIPQGMYDALASLAFNVGSIADSKLAAAVNRGDFDAASLEFRDWNKITQKKNGREVKLPNNGLTARRRKEEDMFNGYGYGAN